MSNIKKMLLLAVYVGSFFICILPNIPKTKNASYDEPNVELIIEETSSDKFNDQLDEGSCHFEKHQSESSNFLESEKCE